MTLAEAFRSTVDPELLEQFPAARLEGSLAALVERGRARWPGLPLEPEHLAAEIGARVRSPSELEALQLEDLYLALACARGVPGALAAFDAEHLRPGALAAAIKRLDPSPSFLDEVRQIARERFFVPPPGHIAEYSGRGALGAWTRVTVLRIAFKLRPRRIEVAEPIDTAQGVNSDPELRFLQDKYGKQFEQALAASFALLDDEQHNLLRLQFVDHFGGGTDRGSLRRRSIDD